MGKTISKINIFFFLLVLLMPFATAQSEIVIDSSIDVNAQSDYSNYINNLNFLQRLQYYITSLKVPTQTSFGTGIEYDCLTPRKVNAPISRGTSLKITTTAELDWYRYQVWTTSGTLARTGYIQAGKSVIESGLNPNIDYTFSSFGCIKRSAPEVKVEDCKGYLTQASKCLNPDNEESVPYINQQAGVLCCIEKPITQQVCTNPTKKIGESVCDGQTSKLCILRNNAIVEYAIKDCTNFGGCIEGQCRSSTEIIPEDEEKEEKEIPLKNQISLTEKDIETATPETIITAVCKTTSQCKPYEDLNGNKDYSVNCRSTPNIRQKITESASEACKTSITDKVKYIFAGAGVVGSLSCAGAGILYVLPEPIISKAGAGVLTGICLGSVATGVGAIGVQSSLQIGCVTYKESEGSGLCIATKKTSSSNFLASFGSTIRGFGVDVGLDDQTLGIIAILVILFIIIIMMR